MQQVMMIVPVNGKKDKTEDIRKKLGQKPGEVRTTRPPGHFQLKHHYCDQYGDDAVTERFQPALTHDDTSPPACGRVSCFPA
jgi:hypothetical protein